MHITHKFFVDFIVAFLNGTDVIIAWLFIIGLLLCWAYSEGFFDGLLDKAKNEESGEEE